MKVDRVSWQCPVCHKSHDWKWQRGDASEGEIFMVCDRKKCAAETKGLMTRISKHAWSVVFGVSASKWTA
jgi:hypothetical protein